ncbi:hypothetical protein ACGFJC_42865 [Nonomuraea fuscirosea]
MLYLSNHAAMPTELSGLGVWMEGTGDGTTRRYDILDAQGYLYLGRRTVWLSDQYMRDNPTPIARKGAAWSTAWLASEIVDRPGERG